MDKEIKYDNLLTNLLDEEKLTQEHVDIIQEYVDELKDDVADLENTVADLEYDNDDLESRISSLEDDLHEQKVQVNERLVSLIREIAEERYKYSKQNCTYTTVDKILDRLEFILKYEV